MSMAIMRRHVTVRRRMAMTIEAITGNFTATCGKRIGMFIANCATKNTMVPLVRNCAARIKKRTGN